MIVCYIVAAWAPTRSRARGRGPRRGPWWPCRAPIIIIIIIIITANFPCCSITWIHTSRVLVVLVHVILDYIILPSTMSEVLMPIASTCLWPVAYGEHPDWRVCRIIYIYIYLYIERERERERERCIHIYIYIYVWFMNLGVVLVYLCLFSFACLFIAREHQTGERPQNNLRSMGGSTNGSSMATSMSFRLWLQAESLCWQFSTWSGTTSPVVSALRWDLWGPGVKSLKPKGPPINRRRSNPRNLAPTQGSKDISAYPCAHCARVSSIRLFLHAPRDVGKGY